MKKLLLVILTIHFVFSTFSQSPELTWAFRLGDGGLAYKVEVDPESNVYVYGTFIDSVDFDPGLGIDSIELNNSNFFLLKLNDQADYVWSETLGLGNSSFVNISIDPIGNIHLGKYYSSVEIEILNSMGQLISRETQQKSEKFQLKLPAQSGLYFFKMKADGRSAVLIRT